MIHFYVLWCAWASGPTAAVISCHSHNTEYQCTVATYAVSASMFQVERMMTSLLAVMITFGTQAVGKLAKRLSDWQPLSVSCCYREGKCQDVWCLAAWHCVSDSCQRCPRAGAVPRVWSLRRVVTSGIQNRWMMGTITCLLSRYLSEIHEFSANWTQQDLPSIPC